MKYTKYIYTVIFQLVFLALITGQSTDAKSTLNNGRPAGVVPKINKDKVDSPIRNVDTFRGGSDSDGAVNHDIKGNESEWTMPQDLDMLLDMIEDGGAGGDSDSDITKLQNQLEELILENLQMREDLDFLLRNIEKCCDVRGPRGPKGDNYSAYILQNTPNPTVSNARISFNIPDVFNSASIKFIDMSGKIVKTFPISDTGFNSIEIESNEFNPGSYIYTLIVDGQAVESKVMNVAK